MRFPTLRDGVARRTRHALFALALAWPPALAWPATLQGKVVSVVDGDTITVLDASKTQHKVRLAGIDAPEKGQPFSNASRKHLALLAAGKQARIKYEKYDRYSRVVGQVWVAPPDVCPDARPECPKTLDVGLAQITVGLAWHFKRYAHEQSEEDQGRYGFAEEEARAKKAGLWAERNPLAPWEWRRSGR